MINKVLETFIRDFGPYCLCVCTMNSLLCSRNQFRDDLSFAIWDHPTSEDGYMTSNNTQEGRCHV